MNHYSNFYCLADISASAFPCIGVIAGCAGMAIIVLAYILVWIYSRKYTLGNMLVIALNVVLLIANFPPFTPVDIHDCYYITSAPGRHDLFFILFIITTAMPIWHFKFRNDN